MAKEHAKTKQTVSDDKSRKLKISDCKAQCVSNLELIGDRERHAACTFICICSALKAGMIRVITSVVQLLRGEKVLNKLFLWLQHKFLLIYSVRKSSGSSL